LAIAYEEIGRGQNFRTFNINIQKVLVTGDQDVCIKIVKRALSYSV